MKKHSILIAVVIIAVLFAIFLLKDKSSPENLTVQSDDGKASLEIPLDALPEGVSIEEISVVSVPADEGFAYELKPDGLQFNEDILFIATIDNASNTVPLVFHISGEDNVELVDNIEIVIDLETNQTLVSAPISHFSIMFIDTHTIGEAMDAELARTFFTINASVSDTPVGQNVTGNFVISKTGVGAHYSYGESSWSHTLDKATFSGTLYELFGEIVDRLSPRELKNSPPPTVFLGDSYTTSVSGFKCKKKGITRIEYILKMNFSQIQKFEGSSPRSPEDVKLTIRVYTPKFKCTETKTSPKPAGSQSVDGPLFVRALSDYLNPGTQTISTRSEEGIEISLAGPVMLKVGQTVKFALEIKNVSKDFLPDTPFSFRQETGTFFTAGPITLGELDGAIGTGARTFSPNEAGATHSVFDVTCNAVGNATITFQSKGKTGVTKPESSYSITIDFNLECISDDDSSSSSGYSEETEDEPVYVVGTEYPDAEKQFVVVYTIDGVPYAQGQFQYADPEQSVSPTVGCPFYHIHSNVAVYPFQQWFVGDVLETNAGGPITDPASEKCGFGRDVMLGIKRAFVPIPHMLEVCSQYAFDSIEPNSDLDTSSLSQLKGLCATLSN